MTQLLDLPAELLSAITEQLPYPDSLSLKLSCRYFNDSIEITVKRRVGWLISRSGQGLPVPVMNKLNLKTDAGFCSSPEVRGFLLHRRKHWECHVYSSGICLVNGTLTCPEASCSTRRTRAALQSKKAMLSHIGTRIEQVYLLLQNNTHVLLVFLLSIVLQTG